MARFVEDDQEDARQANATTTSQGPNPSVVVTVEIPVFKPVPQRGAARKAHSKFATQLESSPEKTPLKKRKQNNGSLELDEDKISSSPNNKRGRVNGNSKPRGSAPALLSQATSSLSADVSTTAERKPKKKVKQYHSKARARFQSNATTRRSESQSSHLSSSLSPPPPAPKEKTPPRIPPEPVTKPKRSRISAFGGVDQDDDLQRSPTKKHKAQASPRSRKSLPNPSPSPLLPKISKPSPRKVTSKITSRRASSPVGLSHDTSSGTVVWTKVDSEGNILTDPSYDGSAYWWPAEITATQTNSRTVKVLGIPTATQEQDVENSAHYALMTFRTHDPKHPSIRFNEQDFVISPNEESQSPSSVPESVLSRWKAAYTEASHLDAKENDDLPDFRFLSQTSSARKAKGNNGIITKSDQRDASDEGDRENSPIPETKTSKWQPDPYLEVDNYGVARTKGVYWPVKVLSIHPPSSNKRGAEGKYEVLFFDGEQKKVPAKDIISIESEEFLTCKMGEIVSAGNEEDSEDHADAPGLRTTPLPRSPSPPARSIAPTEDEFVELSLREQMVLVFPTLQRIIQGDFPFSKRHDDFIAGGLRRYELAKNFVKGDLTPSEIYAVLDEIRRWALRGERWAQRSTPPRDTPGSMSDAEKIESTEPVKSDFDFHALTPSMQYPRILGCEAYESLLPSERSQYCADVLLPEALIQLHIWRRELRPGPMTRGTEEEEAELYSKAKASLAEEKAIDAWVDYVLSMRSQRQIARGIKPESSRRESDRGNRVESGTTRSRRRFD
ncbi:hypothetical protein FRC02_006611 [Tulasnella sp. 418]|nr:hypothetical protein FRC02_006611 [Tulasnella sp. 418]